MPVKTTVHIDGLQELGRALGALKTDMAEKISFQATGAAAQVIKKRWKAKYRANPSIVTGLVEKNVVAKKLSKNQTTLTAEHIVTVRKKVYPLKAGETKKRNTRQVASYLEFGTVKMHAEPAARPAFDGGKEQAVQAMTDKLKKGIDKANTK